MREFKREARSFPVQAVGDFREETVFSTLKDRDNLDMPQTTCLHSSATVLNQHLLGQILCRALKMVQNTDGLYSWRVQSFRGKRILKCLKSKTIINPKFRRRDTFQQGLGEEMQVMRKGPILGLPGCEEVLMNAYYITLYHLISICMPYLTVSKVHCFLFSSF